MKYFSLFTRFLKENKIYNKEKSFLLKYDIYNKSDILKRLDINAVFSNGEFNTKWVKLIDYIANQCNFELFKKCFYHFINEFDNKSQIYKHIDISNLHFLYKNREILLFFLYNVTNRNYTYNIYWLKLQYNWKIYFLNFILTKKI